MTENKALEIRFRSAIYNTPRLANVLFHTSACLRICFHDLFCLFHFYIFYANVRPAFYKKNNI